MIRVALCDDTESELAKLLAYTNAYLQEHELTMQIFAFSHPDELLSNLEKVPFHLYILDIVMPMIDGISLGKEIRKFDREAQIIYTTTEAGFALGSFAANPVNFLVKPIEKQAFFETLQLAFSKIQSEDALYTLRTREGIYTFPQNKIVYCEYAGRSVKCTLLGGEVLSGLSIGQSFSQQIAPLLQSSDFLQPHNSFAVNLRYVEKLTHEAFYLRGGAAVPVSKKQYTAARNAYLHYLLKKEER